MLRRNPDLIPTIISDPRFEVPASYDEDWDIETLFQIYEFILSKLEKVKFCYFIDGLD